MTEEIEDSESRVYEVGFLFLPTLSEEEVGREHVALRELISGLGGEVISDEAPKLIQLAYTMEKTISNVRSKYKSAYFGWIKFVAVPGKAPELKKQLDLHSQVLRFITIKTVRENTVVGRRFVRDSSYRRPPVQRRKEEVGAVPINKEAIDKEIEAMVAD
jgi:ribosomal protein S6